MSNNFENFGTAGQQDAGQEYAPATTNVEGMKFAAAPGDAAEVVRADTDPVYAVDFAEIATTEKMAAKVEEMLAHMRGDDQRTFDTLVQEFPPMPQLSPEETQLHADYAEDCAVAAALAEGGERKAEVATVASAFDSAGRDHDPLFCDKVAKWSRTAASALVVGLGAALVPSMASAGEHHDRPSVGQLFKKYAERELRQQGAIAGSEAGAMIGGAARVMIIGGIQKAIEQNTGVRVEVPGGVVVQGGQVPGYGGLPPLPGVVGGVPGGYESQARIELQRQLSHWEAEYARLDALSATQSERAHAADKLARQTGDPAAWTARANEINAYNQTRLSMKTAENQIRELQIKIQNTR